MIKICTLSQEPFEISAKEAAFCERLGMPLPTTSPQERLRALMATRNEWKLYRRTCDATGEAIVSAYPPDSPFKVYKNSVWWGDTWNALDYGREFDFNRPFFEQFQELQKVVPREGTSVFNSENCDYNGHIRESKNCYLNSLVAKCEDTHYSYWMVKDKDVLDSMYTNESTLCYWCSDVNNGYECVLVEESNNVKECYFSYQLRGCDHCIFSSNLTNKSYYLFNQPCTKEQFEEIKNRLLNGTYTRWQEAYGHFLDMRKKAIHRFAHNLNCENVSGDHAYNCRNCVDCFDSFESEDGLNVISMANSKDVHNAYSAGWPGCEVIYQCCVSRGCKESSFCTYTWFSTNMIYSDSCSTCESCFGSIGLKHKKYCILNKQYSKEDYEQLLPKVIAHLKKTGEWGQFFPQAVLPYAYNETGAQDFFPLAQEDAIKRGYRWREKDKKEYQKATLEKPSDSIHETTESITKEILACAECSKNYKIIPQEFKFYQQLKLPIPRHCPECRHKSRFSRRNPYRLFNRKCNQCQKEIRSTYAADRSEKVVCEKCYLNTVL